MNFSCQFNFKLSVIFLIIVCIHSQAFSIRFEFRPFFNPRKPKSFIYLFFLLICCRISFHFLCTSSLFYTLTKKNVELCRCVAKNVLHINFETSIEIARREMKH